MMYKLWFDESDDSYTITEADVNAPGRAILLIEADNWNDACQQRNDFLGWGKYIPMEAI